MPSTASSALVEYLYAIRQVERLDEKGNPEYCKRVGKGIQMGRQAPVPAGFFLLPDSTYISAVIANPSGTYPNSIEWVS
jgi:hypothetical protein